MIGCFDTKAEDFEFLYDCLVSEGVSVISVNTGVFETSTTFPIDITAESVATLAGTPLHEMVARKDRGLVVRMMGEGGAQVLKNLLSQEKLDGVIGMGGGGGTYICLAAMQPVPLGIPKLCLSTFATKDLSRQVGIKDIVLMPSVVDVAGLNSISKLLISQAAGAICGMMRVAPDNQPDTGIRIGISMFGNTTQCVEECSRLLREKGFEVLAFHAVGVGGQTLEALVREGSIKAVLDITTTELADELCHGVCSAGPNRLTAASEMGVPQVVVPGCLDMVNYGHLDTVPEQYKSRQLYSWAPDVTLMRTNEEENRTLGATIARKLNQSSGAVAVLLPLQGISVVSSKGGTFHNPEVDQVLFDTLKEALDPAIQVIEVDANINDPSFAAEAVETLLKMLD